MPLSGFGARRLSDSSIGRDAETERDTLRQNDHRDREVASERSLEDDLVVIPDLGDRDAENQVHDLLQMHGLSTRQSSTSMATDDHESIY